TGPNWRVLIWLAALFVSAMFLMMNLRGGQQSVKQISYSQFVQAVKAGRVAAVTLQGQSVTGHFNKQVNKQAYGQNSKSQQQHRSGTHNAGAGNSGNSGNSGDQTKQAQQTGANQNAQEQQQTEPDFKTTRPQSSGDKLIDLLQQHDVAINVVSSQTQWWQRLLISLLPWLIIIAVFIFIARRMRQRMGGDGQGGMFGLGRSRARRFRQGSTGVTMDQVAGAQNAKNDVQEIISYLSHPGRYHRLGARIPRGVLLMGPPGTGKTLLAKAVAG